MSNFAKLAKNFGLVGLARLVMNIRGLILLPVLAKTLGAHDYGVWSLIFAILSLMMPILLLGLPSALVRSFSHNSDKMSFSRGFFTVFFTISLISVIASLFMYGLSDIIGVGLFKNESITLIIKFTSFFIIFDALTQTSLEVFRIIDQIKWYSALIISQTIIEVCLISFFVLSGYGLVGAVASLIITRAVILLISLIIIIRHCGISLPDPGILHPYLSFGLPLIPSVVFEIVVALSDRYIIGFFHGATDVGIYSAAYSLGSIVVFPLGPLTYVLSPTVFKLHDENKIDMVRAYFSSSLKYFMMICIPSIFGVSVLAKSVLYSLATPEFITLGVYIVPLVALSMAFEGVRAIYGTILLLSKKTKIFSTASIIAGILNILLNILLVPLFGVVIAALTTLISYVLLGYIMYYNSQKYIKFDLDSNVISKCILSSIIMTLIIWLINPSNKLMILLSIGTGIIIYFSLLFLLNGFNKEERLLINNFIDLKALKIKIKSVLSNIKNI